MSQSLTNVHQFTFWSGQKTHNRHLQWLRRTIHQFWTSLVNKCKKLQSIKRTWLLRQKKRRLTWLKCKLTLRKSHTKKLLQKSIKVQKKLTIYTRQFVLTSHRLKLCKVSSKHQWYQIHLSLTLSLQVTKMI